MTSGEALQLDCATGISVLHVGAGRYPSGRTDHATFDIWRNLASGCGRYAVIGRSTTAQTKVQREENLEVHLIASWMQSEAEFLLTQLATVKMARTVQADVIIAQCPVLGGLAASFIKARLGTPVLMEFHGSHYFSNGNASFKERVIQALTRASLPHATRIRALSDGMKRRIESQFGANLSDRISVVPPRVDLSVFRHCRKDWRLDGRPKVVIVGSVTPRKGQVRFLRAVLQSGIDLDVWLVGDGPDLPRCLEVAAQFGREGSVKSLGRLTHSALAELLPKADALVLYSNMEGTPRAIMEGMAAGLPIVATNAGFVSDILSSGEEGFVLGPDPDREVVQVLERLLADENLRARLGQAGRARVEGEFDAKIVYERYRSLIRETAST